MSENRIEPRFRLTVPESFFQTVASNMGAPFADSYLSGATFDGSKLTPRTAIGYQRMMDRQDFRDLMKRLSVAVVKPSPLVPGDGRLMAKDLY